MAIAWQKVDPRSGWTAMSAYYRVRYEAWKDSFEAYHIEPLGGRPMLIDHAETLDDAKRACQNHSERTAAPPAPTGD